MFKCKVDKFLFPKLTFYSSRCKRSSAQKRTNPLAFADFSTFNTFNNSIFCDTMVTNEKTVYCAFKSLLANKNPFLLKKIVHFHSIKFSFSSDKMFVFIQSDSLSHPIKY